MLLFASITFAQDTFVRNYTSYINTRNSIQEPEKKTHLIVIFNADKENKVVFRYANGNSRTFYQVGEVINNKTNGGFEYQLIKVIDDENGQEFELQLFDNDNALRLIFSEGNNIEFYK